MRMSMMSHRKREYYCFSRIRCSCCAGWWFTSFSRFTMLTSKRGEEGSNCRVYYSAPDLFSYQPLPSRLSVLFPDPWVA